MRTRHIFPVVVAVALAAGGCGTDSKPGAAPSPIVTAGSSEASSPPAAAPDAKTVLDKLVAAKVGLTNPAAQDENTDPNNLLGRPGGYTSRASADMPGGDTEAKAYDVDRGLVIEVFAASADADTRSKYIQDTLKSMPILGTEYHYRTGGGAVLVRVSGKVKPSVAKKVEQAVTGM